jgi:hypothetical protein
MYNENSTTEDLSSGDNGNRKSESSNVELLFPEAISATEGELWRVEQF